LIFRLSNFFIVLVFIFQKSIIVNEIALGDERLMMTSLQDAMPSRFNTRPIMTGGWTYLRSLYIKFDNRIKIDYFVSIIEYQKNSSLTSLVLNDKYVESYVGICCFY